MTFNSFCWMKVSVFCSLWGVFKACSWKDLLLIWPKYCVRIKIITFSSSQNNYLAYLSMGNQIGVGLMPPYFIIQNFTDWSDFFLQCLAGVLFGLKFLFLRVLITAGDISKVGLIHILLKRKHGNNYKTIHTYNRSECRCEYCADLQLK